MHFFKKIFLSLFFFLFIFYVFESRAAEFLLSQEEAALLTEACQANPEIQGAVLNAQASSSAATYSDYLGFPVIEMDSAAGDSGARIVTTSLKQTIWDGGKISADKKSMRGRGQADSFGAESKKDDVMLRVLDTYFNLSRTAEQEIIAQENVDKLKKFYDSSVRRKETGLGNAADVSLAFSRLQQANATLTFWHGEHIRFANSYLSLLGKPAGSSVSIVDKDMFPIALSQQEAENMAVARSPLLAAMKQEIAIAKADVDRSKSELWPVVFAKANYTAGENNTSTNDGGSITLNMQWQNDVGLSQRYKIKAAKEKASSAEVALRTSENNIRELVANLFDGYRTSEEKIGQLQQFKQSAEETAAMYENQFKIGKRSWPDLINSLQDLYSAKSQLKEAEYQSVLFKHKLMLLTGGLDKQINCHAN